MDEFTVKLGSNASSKKFNLFKLHKDDNVSWTEAKMRRENDFQPWQIKLGTGRTARRFKAIKEGGVGDNASYFVFYKPDGKSDTYEVCPVEEWYNVSATQRYKTLTAEEAEQRFEQRHKTLNFFSVMHLKKNGENSEDGVSGRDSKSFKVSELDDWDQSGDDEGSGDDGFNSDDSRKKARKKKTVKKEEPDDAPDEAKEESDEGDFEQREVDYMSDVSSDSSMSEEARDKTDVKGIAEEEALRDLLSTDEEEDGENPPQKGAKAGDKKANMGISSDIKQDPYANDSDDSSDSDDYDVDDEKMDSMFNNKPMFKQEIKQEPAEPTVNKQPANVNKRKFVPEVTTAPPPQPPVPKRPCTSEAVAPNSQEKIIEEHIKKYLSRKPMTLKNLLKEVKGKLRRSGSTPEMDNDLVNTIASIIKRLQPEKQRIMK